MRSGTHHAFAQVGIRFVARDHETAYRAGVAWRSYRSEGGARSRLVGDFLIGAHSLVQADARLTRDRGFFRNHFADLRIIDPTAT